MKSMLAFIILACGLAAGLPAAPEALPLAAIYNEHGKINTQDATTVLKGATRFQALRAILPLVAPGIGAFVVLCILFAWNDYLFAAIIGSGGAKTLPAATRELVQPQNIQWGQIMAAGTVTALPMMFLGLIIRKYLVTGLTMGAVKE